MIDEDDYRPRARRGNAPRRSKDRPEHAQAIAAFVVAIDRGRITCAIPGGTTVIAVKARELGRKGVTVGDHVRLVGDVSGSAGTLARLVRIDPRRTTLRRTADDTDPVERVIVANADQLAIVTATTNPEPRTGLIDRILVAAIEASIHPLLVITKSDLAPADALLKHYADLNLDILTIQAKAGIGLADLHRQLAGKVTVLVGHSGVGKSTLVNALVPAADRLTAEVNAVTGRGRHTSTSAVAFPIPNGWVIDTPGVRSFGIAHISPAQVLTAFPEFADGTSECPRACPHANLDGSAALDCALDAAAAKLGPAAIHRLESLRRLLQALLGAEGY